jgi:DUF4097 and DUF4098 domain-containing protein YvlB
MLYFGLLTVISGTLFGQVTVKQSFGEGTITQEGGYWVRTMTGNPPIPPNTNFVATSRGAVLLKGSNDSPPAFRLVQRVRARSEEEARQFFSVVQIRSGTLGNVARFEVTTGAYPQVSTKLELTVPAHLASATVSTQMGTVEAYDLDCAVDLTTAAGPIHVDRVRGAVASRTGGGEIRIGKIGGGLRAVSLAGSILADSIGGEGSLETAGGEIEVKDSAGKLVLSTAGGNISVSNAGGSVDARSGEGMIEVLKAAGIVTAATNAGSIQVGSAYGVRAESAQGQVRLKGASGPIRVSAASGNILAELFRGMPLDNSTLMSGAGDITVLIPSNLAVSVTASSQSQGLQRIVSDFSEVRITNVGLLRMPVQAQGAINGGGPMLSLSATGGVIYLRRK